MTFSAKQALGGFGWLVAGVALLAGAAGGDVAEPLERIDDLVAGSPAVESPVCPPDYTQLPLGVGPATADSEGRTIVVLCERGTFKLRGFDGGTWERFDTRTGDVSNAP